MQIRWQHPSKLQVVGGEELREWRERLRRRVPGYQFSHEYKRRRWDGYHYPGTRLLRRGGQCTLECSRGLLPRLLRDFPDAELITEWSHQHGELPFKADPSVLRDYQVEAIRLAGSRYWGRIALATNAGKGAVIGLLSAAAASVDARAVILCDEIAVFNALAEEVQKWAGIQPARVEAGAQQVPDAPVTLAMVPTLHRRVAGKDARREWREWLAGVDMLLLDEADKATAPTWRAIVAAAPYTIWRIGFSGSFPETFNYDELVLEELLGPVLLRVKNKVLIERKISARPQVDLYPMTHYFRGERGVYPTRIEVYDQCIVHNERRHQYVRSLLETDAPNAIIVNRVEHGRQLAEYLPDARFLYGEDSKEVREAVLEAFRRGDFQNLVVTKILDRGTNLLGHAVGLIFASGEGSTRQTLQRVGRGLRRTKGKEFLFLRDIVDRGHKYFNAASKRRILLYNREEFDVRLHREGELDATTAGRTRT